MAIPVRKNDQVVDASWFNDIRDNINQIGGISGIVVGNAGDVASGVANYSSIQVAIDDVATVDGSNIILLPRTFSENIIINKVLKFSGNGYDTILAGTINFATGSTGSSFEAVRFSNIVTINSGVTGIIMDSSIWLSSSGDIVQVDADSSLDSQQNLWLGWQE